MVSYNLKVYIFYHYKNISHAFLINCLFTILGAADYLIWQENGARPVGVKSVVQEQFQ